MGFSKKHKERDRDLESEKNRRKHKRSDKDRHREDGEEKERSEHREKRRHKHRRHRSRSGSQDHGEEERKGRHDKKRSKRHRRERSTSESLNDIAQDNLGEDVFQLVKQVDGDVPKQREKAFPDFEVAATDQRDQRVKKQDQDGSEAKSGTGGNVLSLSIEATNKIRAKLGLPPLTVEGGKNAGPGEQAKTEDQDVHKPPINLGAKKAEEELKAKLALIKEKRKINQKLKKVKKLANDEDDLDDVTAWVERSRKSQLQKDLAAKRAKMLQEMDEQFGIGALVEDEFAPKKENDYTWKNIKDLEVLHSVDSFKEGRNVILTLKDTDVLADDEDRLMNVNILDDEKAAKNVELRKMKKDYQPYKDDVIDEYGMTKARGVLNKYNEEIDGAKVESFRLGNSAAAYDTEEKRQERIRAHLQAQAVSLDMQAPRLASEYYTASEMEAFKKPRKKKRIIKRKFTVDDLMPDEGDTQDDHGSRGHVRGHRRADNSIVDNGGSNNVEGQDSEQLMDMDLDLPDVDQTAILGPEEEEDDLYRGQPIEDEAEQELQMVLSKARKLKQKKQRSQLKVEQKIAEEVSKMEGERLDEQSSEPSIVSSFEGSSAGAMDGKGANITLNSTSEFCRTLGEIPTYGMAGNREDDNDDEAMDYEQEGKDVENLGEEAGQEGWSTVNLEQEDMPLTGDVAGGPVLEEEPTVQTGIYGALNLAMKKGYLEQEFIKSVPKTKKAEEMEAKNFTVEDKTYHDIDAKYNKHDRDRYRGPMSDFKEKEGYKPDVKLKYVDDHGRATTAKEAFRILSHRFHGKGSGKMKTDKRAKKLQEEEAMKKMSSTDTPLNTVSMMKLKQQQTQSPFILLSGGSKSLTANTLAK